MCCTPCQHFELNLCRSNLQIGNEGIDNPTLLLGTAKHKIYGYDFDHLDIAVILRVDDAVLNLFNGHIISNRVERLLDRIFLKKGLELRDLPLLQIDMEPIAAFRLLLLLNIFLVRLLVFRPTRQD